MFDLNATKQYILALIARAFSRDGWLIKLWPLWSLWLICFVAVMFQFPIKAWPALFGVGKVLMGGLLGLIVHWGFRQIRPMPAEPSGIEIGTDWKVCGWIICACIIALAFVP